MWTSESSGWVRIMAPTLCASVSPQMPNPTTFETWKERLPMASWHAVFGTCRLSYWWWRWWRCQQAHVCPLLRGLYFIQVGTLLCIMLSFQMSNKELIPQNPSEIGEPEATRPNQSAVPPRSHEPLLSRFPLATARPLSFPNTFLTIIFSDLWDF